MLFRSVSVRGWRRLGVTGTFITAALVATTSVRPLVQPRWLRGLPGLGSLPERLDEIYLNHRFRAERFVSFLPQLADDEPVGFGAHISGEASLWGTNFSHHVVPLELSDNAQSIRRRGLRHVVVDDAFAVRAGKIDGADWAESLGGCVVNAVPLSPEEARARRGRDQPLTEMTLLWWRVPPGVNIPTDNSYLIEFPN